MLRQALAAALLFSIPAAAIAQSDAGKGAEQDPQAAYRQLSKSYAKAMSAWQDELEATVKKARAAGERVPRSAYAPPTKEFVGTAQELAQQYAGKDDAVMFLGFILKNASNERNAVKWAVRTLAADHVDGQLGLLAHHQADAGQAQRDEQGQDDGQVHRGVAAQALAQVGAHVAQLHGAGVLSRRGEGVVRRGVCGGRAAPSAGSRRRRSPRRARPVRGRAR